MATNNSINSPLLISGGNLVSPGGIASSPVDSHTATVAFGAVTSGTAVQNTLGYDILISGSINVTAAVGGSITLGVASNSTPTTDPLTPALSTALLIGFSAIVPSNDYLLINTSGTITVGSITSIVTPL